MSPLERAARALCEVEHRDPDEEFGSPGATYPFWHLRREAVRAVLQAIREPSEAMLDVDFGSAPIGIDEEAVDVWQAMIDAALAEKPEA